MNIDQLRGLREGNLVQCMEEGGVVCMVLRNDATGATVTRTYCIKELAEWRWPERDRNYPVTFDTLHRGSCIDRRSTDFGVQVFIIASYPDHAIGIIVHEINKTNMEKWHVVKG